MTMVRTVAPTVLAVGIESARDNLRVDGDYMDNQIEDWVRGITRRLEHEVGQCFMEQTWEVRLPQLPSGRDLVELPHPTMEVLSITYLDAGDQKQSLPVAGYLLEVVEYESVLRPFRGAMWPSTPEDGGVVITVKCGYGNTPDKTPETARQYILGKLVEQFDPKSGKERETRQSVYLNGLVDDLRTYA